ncbi:hypothetical protein VOLCADRAFT_89434 [Volvox carteri f. nagariensis]|uniref:Uncharacterized protein n=1 Tax=Volvox carteri f. nagariensis TaxID=3068 RepID=D8TRP1_VOLCA|nr:uncharacterized protein VOLCADRAFT_89434 [Volvox carteri f. nagariensis]EFJ49930.1 hypothetical protein VOLCADRAFT_89434 [Volvox carteri f. nagariensis]|eukprot:XP_002948995.1 hypothetical protein VOLCADRAFT_89434 [Volvox carteri f. nagariensis]
MKANNVACKTGRLKRPRKRKRLAKRQFAQANELRQRVAQLDTCSFGRRGRASYALRTETKVQRLCNIANISGRVNAAIYLLGQTCMPKQSQVHMQTTGGTGDHLLQLQTDGPYSLELQREPQPYVQGRSGGGLGDHTWQVLVAHLRGIEMSCWVFPWCIGLWWERDLTPGLRLTIGEDLTQNLMGYRCISGS